MEIVVELLGEIFGSFAEWGISSKAPKWLRYTLGMIGLIFTLALIYFTISLGISCFNENDDFWGWICTGIGIIIAVALVIVIIAVKIRGKHQ